MGKVVKMFHSDSGHGWLAVKKKELVDLGIQDVISSCSYMRGQTAYLEEDCDATAYFLAQDKLGIKVEIKRGKFAERSPIRSYPTYSAKTL